MVHENLRRQTGCGQTFGIGFLMSTAGKQKLNTRSSTETELVAADDGMPDVLWTRRFIEAQGRSLIENKLLQDNRAAMLLEKNGKASSGKRTKHIDARYYFITDRIEREDLTVEWCPTEDMVADFWTKPLKGATFRRM